MKSQVMLERSFYLQLLFMVPTIALLEFSCCFDGMGADRLAGD